MVFLSFVYMMDKQLLDEIANKKINQTISINFINSSKITLPISQRIFEIMDTSHLLTIILNKYLDESYLNLPDPNDWIKYESAGKQLYSFLSKYDLHGEVSLIANGKDSNSYIYAYINHIINNLLLFDIVK